MSSPKSLADLQAELTAVIRGESPVPEWIKAEKKPTPDVPGVLTPANVALMRLIAERNPANVAELADMSGQRQSTVSRALQDLARFGLVRLVREEASIRPGPVT